MGSRYGGHPVLTRAIQEGFWEGLDVLLDFNADVNTRDLNGRSPLYHVVKANRLHFVTRMLELNADPNVTSECLL